MNPLCVIDKIKLEQTDTFMFICPKCRKTYNLYYEVMNYEDTIESAYDDSNDIELAGLEAQGPLVEFLDDENEQPLSAEEESEIAEGKIRIPKYFKSEPGKEVINYREEID